MDFPRQLSFFQINFQLDFFFHVLSIIFRFPRLTIQFQALHIKYSIFSPLFKKLYLDVEIYDLNTDYHIDDLCLLSEHGSVSVITILIIFRCESNSFLLQKGPKYIGTRVKDLLARSAQCPFVAIALLTIYGMKNTDHIYKDYRIFQAISFLFYSKDPKISTLMTEGSGVNKDRGTTKIDLQHFFSLPK